MGRLIEESHTTTPMDKEEIVDTLKTMVFGVQAFERFNAKERETLDKAWNIIDQYENRLKADMVAMLEDLDLQIEALEEIPPYDIMDDWEHQICVRTWEVKQIVKEKINALKGENDV